MNRTISDMLLFMYRRVAHQKGILLCSMALLAIVAAIQFSIPQLIQRVVDIAIPQQSMSLLFTYLGGILALAILLSVFNYFSTYLISKVSQTAIVDLRVDFFKHVLKQDYRFFEDQKTGDLMTRFSSDIRTIQDLISPNTLNLIGNVLTFIFIFIFMFVTDWKLTLLIALTFPALYFLNRYFSKHIKQAFRRVRQSTAQINNHLQTSLTSILLIKNFITERFEEKKFEEVNEVNKNNVIAATKLQAGFSPSIEFINYVGMIIVLGYSATQAMKGQVTVGEIMTYLAYLKLLQNPIRSFSAIVSRLQQAIVSYERIMDVYEVAPTVVSPENPKPITPLTKGITFSNVSFHYFAEQDVLQAVNVTLPKGKVTALVGESGSGKTTITRMLARMYDPSIGEILWDDTPIHQFHLTDFRHQIGIVSQDVELIDGTIEENIQYGSPQASQAEIYEAAQKAKLLDFIQDLPNGFQTQVGERGIKLSGGQKQRISIARVFLKDAPILILDEATAALDNSSEKFIQSSLQHLMAEKTTLVIAHRLSTIHHADMIHVMDKGEIIESGSHKELMARKGNYHTLYEAQFA